MIFKNHNLLDQKNYYFAFMIYSFKNMKKLYSFFAWEDLLVYFSI